jgi:hypothetical protein
MADPKVLTIITRDRIRPLYTVQLVRKVAIETRGSSSRNNDTSYPFMFRKSVMAIKMTKRLKKKTE